MGGMNDDFHGGMQSKCGQRRAFTCSKQFDGVLAPLTWTFEYEKCLCTPKHGEGMKISRISHPTSTLASKACMEGKQYATKLYNGTNKQATKPLVIVAP